MKLLAFDLDGTVIPRSQVLSPRNRAALKAAADKGVLLIPSTGRVRRFIHTEVSELDFVRYIATSNGASIYDKQKDQVIYRDLISNDKALAVQKIIDNHEILLEYYIHGDSYCKKDDFEKAMELARKHFKIEEKEMPFPKRQMIYVRNYAEMLQDTRACPEKINILYVDSAVYQQVMNEINALGDLTISSTFATNMEINNHTATKGTALQYLAELHGAKPEEVMAIGDGGNDIHMLDYAGVSVAMGNAPASVKSYAKYETGSCEEDGFAMAIEKFIL